MSAMPIDMRRMLERDNVHVPEGAGAALSGVLMLAGAVMTGACVASMFGGDAERARLALHSYHVGFLATLGFSLSGMGVVMIFHQTNAGWTGAIRRQFENLMSLVWVAGLFFLLGVLLQGVLMGKGVYLFDWMNSAATDGDVLYAKKAGYLNLPFFLIRAAVYFALWLGMGYFLWNFSAKQDRDGDKWHSAAARKLSAPGLIVFALTTAFAGFDWVMSLDYHWYSTMLGVWFFAGNTVSAIALGTLVLLVLRGLGRLHGVFTGEHLHDLGKMLFAFTVFWAYISFSQYFLIWYANIPEETAYFVTRKSGSWEVFSKILPVCHFIIPFVWLMARPARRTPLVVGIGCVWLIVMHVVDVFWYVRPEAGEVGPSTAWIDVCGAFGPVLVFLGLLVRKVAAGPLIAMKDPRLDEALHHKNFV